ncbi:MAG: hypothetical protein ACTS73_07835 [Arsenophonus sp. NEOnobi-MAG3]
MNYFSKNGVKEIWRGAVIQLLRHSYDLINPISLSVFLGYISYKKSSPLQEEQWERYLNGTVGTLLESALG